VGTDKYIMIGDRVVRCESLITWARWFEAANRHMAHDVIGAVRISTVFLGLDHNFNPHGPPILFETMIFGGTHDQYQDRYATKAEALAGHARAVNMVRETTHESRTTRRDQEVD
jgi:hypothetical protein